VNNCDKECKCEEGYVSEKENKCVEVKLCGNGRIDRGEECEPRFKGCSSDCKCEKYYKPDGEGHCDELEECTVLLDFHFSDVIQYKFDRDSEEWEYRVDQRTLMLWGDPEWSSWNSVNSDFSLSLTDFGRHANIMKLLADSNEEDGLNILIIKGNSLAWGETVKKECD